MDISAYIKRMNQLYGSEQQVASNPLNFPEHMIHQYEGGQLTPEEFYQHQSIPQSARPLTGAEGGRVYDTRKYLQGGRVQYKPGGLVEPGVMYYAKEDWSSSAVRAAEKYYNVKIKDLKWTTDRKILDQIDKNIKRNKGRFVVPKKMQQGIEAPWLDVVSEKIIEYNKNQDATVFISRSERALHTPGKGTTLPGFLNLNQAQKFAKATDAQIAWLAERSGVSRTVIKNAQKKYNAIPDSDKRFVTDKRREYWKRKVKIQEDILAQIEKGVLDSKQMAKNLKINHKKLIGESEKLFLNVYAERLKLNKGLDSTSVFLPKTTKELRGVLDKLWTVKGFEGAEGRTWFKLIRDAREAGRITKNQFIRANSNVIDFYKMKEAIQEKYPKLVLNLDHPLSFGALKELGAKGEQFLTGVPSTERFNKGIKQRLDNKYASVVSDVRQGVPGAVNQKIAIEKLAKNLNMDIGEISKRGKKIVSLGKKDIVSGKTPLGRGIIESLQEQTELAKKIGKVDPKLLEAAKMTDYFRRVNLNEVSKNDLKGVAKILSDNGFTCKLQGGLTCNNPKAYIQSINEQKALALAGDAKAAKNFSKVSKAANAARGISKFTLWGILGEVAFAPLFALPMLAKGESWNRIMNDISWGAFGESEREELKRVSGIKGTQSLEALEAGEKLTKLESLPLAKKVAPVDSFIGGDRRRKEKLQARSAAVIAARKKELEESGKTFIEKIQPFMVNESFDVEAFEKAGGDVEAAKAQIAKEKLARKESSTFFQDKLDPTEAMVGFDAGGRVGFKLGGIDKGRRTFMKWLAAITGTTVAGATGLLKWGKVAGKGKTAIKAGDTIIQGTQGRPDWFIPLVNRIVKEGDDVTKKLGTVEREIVHTKKIGKGEEVTVYQNLDTGNVRVDYDSPHNMGEGMGPVSLEYRAPQVIDEGKYKGQKADPEFEAYEPEPVGYTHGPDDYAIEWDGLNVVGRAEDLVSDTSKLKQFATKKKPTMQEIVTRKKKKDQVSSIHKDESDYIATKQGEGEWDDYLPDIDDMDY